MEKRGVYSFMQGEYLCILVYNDVYTRIVVKKRVFKWYSCENRCILGEYMCIREKTGEYSFI